MDEWLDIVDDSDTVIGRATRSRIHEKSHLHRSSHVLLFNTRGSLFVQLRSHLKDTNAGLWDTSAAGHVDSGENYLDCAIRELHEELGVILGPDDFETIGKLSPEASNGYEFSTIYTAFSDQPLVLQSEEIDDGVWVTAQELDQWIDDRRADFTETFLVVWTMLKSNKSSSK
ncbi:MAG: NUDIX domain-containing protein [Granulosicoccus sp.]